jgi:hypothetical protein
MVNLLPVLEINLDKNQFQFNSDRSTSGYLARRLQQEFISDFKLDDVGYLHNQKPTLGNA